MSQKKAPPLQGVAVFACSCSLAGATAHVEVQGPAESAGETTDAGDAALGMSALGISNEAFQPSHKDPNHTIIRLAGCVGLCCVL